MPADDINEHILESHGLYVCPQKCGFFMRHHNGSGISKHFNSARCKNQLERIALLRGIATPAGGAVAPASDGGAAVAPVAPADGN